MHTKRTLVWGVACLVAALAISASADARVTGGGEIMTNKKIIDLVRANLSDTMIVRMIKSASRTQFDVSTEGVLQLVDAGTSEDVISAMMDINEKETDSELVLRSSLYLILPCPFLRIIGPFLIGYSPHLSHLGVIHVGGNRQFLARHQNIPFQQISLSA